jgi:DNA-binding FrmR family transcriptional regulator
MAEKKKTEKTAKKSALLKTTSPDPNTPGCAHCATDCATEKRVTQPNKIALLNRLKRIEGQIGGIRNMVEEDRYCVDIIMQLSAVKAAIDGVSIQLLSTHANGCVRKAVMEDGGEDALEELLGVIRKMMR